jgi:hypothetical protein
MGLRIRALAGAVAICACTAGAAQATPTAKLNVGLSPERLGASTTMSFAFTIPESAEALPPALTALDVGLPPGMGVDLSGVQTCTSKALAHGPKGCSSGSRVGTGSVLVQVPLGEVTRPERAALTVFNGPRKGGHTTLLFDAVGKLPIATELIFEGVLVPGAGGQKIEASIPLIPTLPDTPDAAIVSMNATLGTRQQAYYRTVGGQRTRFTPKGATVPARCPAGGFPFSASFGFNDSEVATATAVVTCPE